MRKVIEVRNLVKRYGEIIAVDGISFEVYHREIFSLVGPNGAGKTTTVEILECLRKPTSGTARVLGKNVTEHEMEIKERIGVLPQDFNAFERLTVEENVALIAKIYDSEENIRKVLETLGLWEIRKRKFGELSGGTKKRVGIAMALVSEPEIIFLDEPTTGLDPQGRREVWETLKALREVGKTIFLTTHYMEEVETLADRASLMVRGKILATGSVPSLISKYGGGFRILTGKNEKALYLLKKAGAEISLRDGEVLAEFDSRNTMLRTFLLLQKKGLPSRIVEPSMNEVFLNLAGGRINERGELVT